VVFERDLRELLGNNPDTSKALRKYAYTPHSCNFPAINDPSHAASAAAATLTFSQLHSAQQMHVSILTSRCTPLTLSPAACTAAAGRCVPPKRL
jgi:hypothetical protein